MNTLALCDGALALAALALGWSGRARADARVAAFLLAGASSLGVLRYVDLLPDPRAHRLLSSLAGGVGLAALARALVARDRSLSKAHALAASALALAAVAAWLVPALGVLVRVASLGAVGAIATFGARERRLELLAIAIFLVAAFASFAAQLRPGGLAPEDLLHLGMAAAILIAARTIASRATP